MSPVLLRQKSLTAFYTPVAVGERYDAESSYSSVNTTVKCVLYLSLCSRMQFLKTIGDMVAFFPFLET